MKKDIKKLAGSVFLAGLLATPTLLAGEEGILWIHLKEGKTFSDYEISQVIIEPYCEKRSFFNELQNIPIIASKTESNIDTVKKLGLIMNCTENTQTTAGKFSNELKATAVTMQLVYDGHRINCGKQTLENPDHWAHTASIETFSGKDKKCTWIAK